MVQLYVRSFGQHCICGVAARTFQRDFLDYSLSLFLSVFKCMQSVIVSHSSTRTQCFQLHQCGNPMELWCPANIDGCCRGAKRSSLLCCWSRRAQGRLPLRSSEEEIAYQSQKEVPPKAWNALQETLGGNTVLPNTCHSWFGEVFVTLTKMIQCTLIQVWMQTDVCK